MSVFKLKIVPKETSKPETDKAPISTPTENTAPQDSQQNTQPKEKTIVLDGPLSQVYTKALLEIYGKKSSDQVETSAEAQAGMIPLLYNSYIKILGEDDDQDQQPDLYIYVTDEKSVNEKNKIELYNDLNFALDSYNKSKKIVMFESVEKLTDNVCLTGETADAHKASIVFNNRGKLDFLRLI